MVVLLLPRQILRVWLLLFLTLTPCADFKADASESFDTVFEVHKASMPYLWEERPSLCIMFSGTPGMGKTTLAKELEMHFRGIRLSSDESRALLRRYGIDVKEVERYLPWVMEKLLALSPNRFIILDRSVDRTYATYLNFCRQHGVASFMIRMSVARECIAERIRSRGNSVEELLKNAERHWCDYCRWGAQYGYDYLFDNNNEGLRDGKIHSLIQAIENRLVVVFPD